MTLPTTTVEIAFNAGWTGTPTWTDVTDYVRHSDAISISHWREAEGEECSPSSLSLVLNNEDGRFTPGNSASPHYPNVTKGRRIRVRSSVNGVTYDRFNGYVDEWTVEWPGKVSPLATCEVTASSRMARLGSTSEMRSIVEEEILGDDPVAYYTLAEPVGSVTASDSSGTSKPQLYGRKTTPTFGEATGPGNDSLTGVTLTGGWLQATFSTAIVPASIECWFSTTGNDGYVIAMGDMAASVTPGGKMSDGVGSNSTPSVNDGNVHHVVLTRNGSDVVAYLDGAQFSSTAGGSSSSAVDMYVGDAFSFTGPVMTVSVTHAAVYTTALSAARVADHYASGVDAFAGEFAGERLEHYARFAGVGAADQDFETGQSTLAHIDTAGKTVLAAMRTVEETEGGVLFDALDGKLTFHDRAHRYGADSSFTLDYASGQIANELRPVLDDQMMCNDMTVTKADVPAEEVAETPEEEIPVSQGVSSRVTDQGSIDDYGSYRQSLELATTDGNEPNNRAAWIVSRYADPTVRVSSLEVQLASSAIGTALTQSILSAEVGTMLTLTNLPSNAPSSSMRLFVEGLSESITADSHVVGISTSPAELFDVWILDDPILSVLDSTTRLAY